MKNTSLTIWLLVICIPLFMGYNIIEKENILQQDNVEQDTAQNKNFTIKGHIKGLGNTTMSLFYKNKQEEPVLQDILVNNGKFTITINVEEPKWIRISPSLTEITKTLGKGKGRIPSRASTIQFLAIPNVTVSIEGQVLDYIDAYPSGEFENDKVAELHKQIYPLINESANLYLKSTELQEDDQLKNTYSKQSESLNNQKDSIVLSFIRNNPKAMVSSYYLDNMILSRKISDSMAISLFRKMKGKQDNIFSNSIKKRVHAMKTIEEGLDFPNFSAENVIDGTTINTENLRGKYILLDFWGTWCSPCVAEMPTVKKYFEKYADKLAVIGIDHGDPRKLIIDYAKSRNYNWPQVMANQENGSFTEKFNVVGFPTKFLIDPNGKLIKRTNGSEVFKIIDELLSK